MQSDDQVGNPVQEVEANTSGTVLLKDEYQPGRAFYVLSQLRRRHQFCDVKVIKDAACFSAHRAILAASSPYLLSLLQSTEKKEGDHQIVLTDPRLTVGALEMLIDFMYTSMLRIKESTVEVLCYAARLLQLSRIEKACVKFIISNIGTHNWFKYLDYAKEHSYLQIKTKCLEHAASNFSRASRVDGFLDVSFENLSNIVLSPLLMAPSQEIVLEAVLRWVNRDPDSRQNDLYPLMQSVKKHSFPQKSHENVREMLDSPRTTAEQVVRSLRACFEKIHHHRHHKGGGEKRETPSGASDGEERQQQPVSSPVYSQLSKTQRKVHFETDEEAEGSDDDTTRELPDIVDQETQTESSENSPKTDVRKEQGGERAQGEEGEMRKSQQKKEADRPHSKAGRPTKLKSPKPSFIYAAGGITATSNTSSVEKYNVAEKNWTSATPLPQKKSHAVLVSSGDKLYSIGGYNGSRRLASVDIFDTKTQRWVSGAPMPIARSGFGATVDRNGHIYCIGGYSNSQQDLSDVDVYDPKHDQWMLAPRLTQCRSYVQAAALGENIYAVGGMEGSNRLQTVEKLSPYTSTWTRVADMNVARSRPGVAALDGRLYVVGGYNGREHLSSVECYSPNSDTWRVVESLSVPRNSPAAAAHNGCLYVAGGHSGKELLCSVECYNPETNKWSMVAPLTTARCDFGMAVLDGGRGGSAREKRTEPQPVGTWI